MNKILITGGYGCIGAETVKWLIRSSDAAVVICSRTVSAERTERVFHDVDRSRITVLPADVTEQRQLQQILTERGITHVVHLAALQTPDCNSYRDLGLQINLAGTQNLIEAIKQVGLPLERFIFASSIAVYGPRAAYETARVPMLAEPQPVNVYGAWKLAGESLSRFFWEDTGVPTISLRPGVLFGPGRDAGLTSTPTTAIKCVALGLPYEIPFRSRQDYLFAPDVGAAVGNAVLEPFTGYGVFTLPSRTLDTAPDRGKLASRGRRIGDHRPIQDYDRQANGAVHLRPGVRSVLSGVSQGSANGARSSAAAIAGSFPGSGQPRLADRGKYQVGRTKRHFRERLCVGKRGQTRMELNPVALADLWRFLLRKSGAKRSFRGDAVMCRKSTAMAKLSSVLTELFNSGRFGAIIARSFGCGRRPRYGLVPP